jgi:hypothetical protein
VTPFELVKLELTPDWTLSLDISAVLLVGLLVVLAVVALGRRWIPLRSWEPVEVEVPFGGMGKLKIRPNHEVVRIAHKAWVELATRKAGLLFDPQDDVVVEIYSSWYQLFAEMRRLAREIPAEQIRKDEDTQKVLELIVDGLNEGLRPHLTKWQARFRHWYERALREAGPEQPPQEIQRDYPSYQELAADLQEVNGKLLQYMNELRKLVRG